MASDRAILFELTALRRGLLGRRSLARSNLRRRTIEHQAAVNMAEDNGGRHQHHRGSHAAEDETEKSQTLGGPRS